MHSKLYIFDFHSSIVGSANFTYGGFVLNHELGLLIENEGEIVTKCHDYFNELYGLICNDRNAIITAKWIVDELDVVRSRMLTRKHVKEDQSKRGAQLPKKKIVDLIEQVISQSWKLIIILEFG